MRLNKKMLAVTAVLAVGILAGCGSSGTAASTPASSVVPASSHVAEEGVGHGAHQHADVDAG